MWRRSIRKNSPRCAPSCGASKSRLAIAPSVGGASRAATPLQTSDALGAASVQLGPAVVALVVEMHTHLGVPLAKIAHLLKTQCGLTVTPGGLTQVLHRTAREAAPTYHGIVRAGAGKSHGHAG